MKHTTIEATIKERSARYGDFTEHARIAMKLKTAMHAQVGWQALDDVKKHALDVIADKIARILNGDPMYADNWHDIAGYAHLVESRLL